jgi:hypothetical protein
MDWILISAFVGWCINCKNTHSMSNIKIIALVEHHRIREKRKSKRISRDYTGIYKGLRKTGNNLSLHSRCADRDSEFLQFWTSDKTFWTEGLPTDEKKYHKASTQSTDYSDHTSYIHTYAAIHIVFWVFFFLHFCLIHIHTIYARTHTHTPNVVLFPLIQDSIHISRKNIWDF